MISAEQAEVSRPWPDARHFAECCHTGLVCTGEREMASENIKKESAALSAEAVEGVTKYGITRVPVDYFHYKQYRYTNLSDAVAQAKRDEEGAD